jgi:hypothetical protein
LARRERRCGTAATHEPGPDERTREAAAAGTPGRRITEWVIGIVAAAAVFFGLFILFAGEDRYLGFGGESWRVGDISQGWAYGLLVGGGLLLVIVLGMILPGRSRRRNQGRGSRRPGGGLRRSDDLVGELH